MRLHTVTCTVISTQWAMGEGQLKMITVDESLPLLCLTVLIFGTKFLALRCILDPGLLWACGRISGGRPSMEKTLALMQLRGSPG